ncbi:MAG TPA: hypothetical protein VFB38_09815 [Chthonomonadaceae bacterium]|nr:hypothetical protein [Chthonomonadaceae bacterium]
MRLTYSEYLQFCKRYYCTFWPDEEFRVPVEVEAPDGSGIWTAYISGKRFHEALNWIAQQRRQPTTTPAVPTPAPAPVVITQKAA